MEKIPECAVFEIVSLYRLRRLWIRENGINLAVIGASNATGTLSQRLYKGGYIKNI